MSALFRLGLVGGGRMGQTHIRALADSSTVQIIAVAEPHAATAEKLRAAGLAVYPTLSAMLEAGGLDGVIITTPTDQHLAVIRQVATAGLPMLCEKPAGLNPAQAHEAAEISRTKGTLLQVGYWRRFIPDLQDLRERIASRAVGTLHVVICSQWDEAPPASAFRSHSGGIFVDMGVHEIDEIRWLTGQEVVGVTALAYPTVEDEDAINDVDSAQALLTLSGGSAAVMSLGRFHPGGDLVAVELFGSRDHVRVAVLQPPDSEGPQMEALRRQAEAFARCALGGPSECATIEDAESALIAAQLLSDAAGLHVLGEVK